MPADVDPRTPAEVTEDRVAFHLLDRMRADVRDAVLAELSLADRMTLRTAAYWERKAGRPRPPWV